MNTVNNLANIGAIFRRGYPPERNLVGLYIGLPFNLLYLVRGPD